MKKLLVLCLALCMTLGAFTSCNTQPPEETTSTVPSVTPVSQYKVKDGVLLSCVGQADENGLYIVPEDIIEIGDAAFAGDETLKEVVIGPNVKLIGSGAFLNCTSLEKVTVKDGASEIGSHAFYNCQSLQEIDLPNTVTTLNQYTFYGCSSLTNMDISSILQIEENAFWDCPSLETVTFAKDLQKIGAWAFALCTSLENMNLADVTALREIGDSAFLGCSMLKSIVIPEGTEKLGKLLFYECNRLCDIDVASTVKTVDYAAFNYTPWYQENSDDYLIVGDGVLIKCNVHPTQLNLADKGIKSLGGAVFWNSETEGTDVGYRYASELTTLEIPETVTEIGTSAFAGCYNLGKITLPANVTYIGDNAFNVYIESIISPTEVDYTACENLTYIGSYAFNGCTNMKKITIPAAVTHVGEYAFASTGAYENFMAAAAKSDADEDHFWIAGDGILLAVYAPVGKTEIIVPDGVKMIAGAALCGWDMPYIPETVEGLSDSGVSKYNLSYTVTRLTLPDTLVSVGNNAFYRMLSLQAVKLPDALTEIGNEAFAFCTNLTLLEGGNDVKSIGAGAFRYCTNITAFQFSSNTVKIGNSVFMGCSALQSVRLPKGLANPGTDLFDADCVSLSSIYMDESAKARVFLILGHLPKSVKVNYYEN